MKEHNETFYYSNQFTYQVFWSTAGLTKGQEKNKLQQKSLIKVFYATQALIFILKTQGVLHLKPDPLTLMPAHSLCSYDMRMK